MRLIQQRCKLSKHVVMRSLCFPCEATTQQLKSSEYIDIHAVCLNRHHLMEHFSLGWHRISSGTYSAYCNNATPPVFKYLSLFKTDLMTIKESFLFFLRLCIISPTLCQQFTILQGNKELLK